MKEIEAFEARKGDGGNIPVKMLLERLERRLKRIEKEAGIKGTYIVSEKLRTNKEYQTLKKRIDVIRQRNKGLQSSLFTSF